MDLPDALRVALDGELAGTATDDIRAATARLSDRYHTQGGHRGLQGRLSSTEVRAYLAYRMPATFSAIQTALAEVRVVQSARSPRSLLDCGAGPGTAMWAALSVWPELERITLIEKDGSMVELGRRLARHSPHAAVRDAIWMPVDVLGPWQCDRFDLVIVAYALGELPAESRTDLIARLWELTDDTLVLVEPGTPHGWSNVRAARDQMRGQGGLVLAPCPHSDMCPLAESDWCHFSARVERTSLHRRAKEARLSHEDEKFSYVAMSRREGSPIASRVIRHPQIRPGHVHLELCTPDGLSHRIVGRSERSVYRQARDVRWGEVFPRDEPLDGS